MTAASVATSDAWQERCLVTITKVGGSDVEFAALTENVKITPGAKDIGQSVLVNGGRVVTYTPQDMVEISLKTYPLEAGTASGTSGLGVFDLNATTDASQPIAITPDFTRTKFRVAIMWYDTGSISSAATAVSSGRALRFTCAEGYFTQAEPDEFNAESPLAVALTFKAAAFDKSASANFKWESTDGSATLPALASYTTSAKW